MSIDLEETVLADATDGESCLVRFHRVAHGLFDLGSVATSVHVDEVHHDQPADDRAAAAGGRPGLAASRLVPRAVSSWLAARVDRPRVDVDGDQGFGPIDDDGAAAGQIDPLSLVDTLDLRIETELGEQGTALCVANQAGLAAGHKGPHVVLDLGRERRRCLPGPPGPSCRDDRAGLARSDPDHCREAESPCSCGPRC